MDSKDIFLSLIIPVYNEGHCIDQNLKDCIEYLSGMNRNFEIIISDDGSTDSTRDIAQQYMRKDARIKLIASNINRGKGSAVKNGMLSARGKYKIFTDADFSTPLFEIEKMLSFLKDGYDVVIGSRRINGANIRVKQPFIRQLMGKGLKCCISTLLFKGIEDTQCGFKGFSRESAERIFPLLQCSGYCFDVEILYLAKKLSYRIKEMPVEWQHAGNSKIKMFSDSIKVFKDLWSIKFRNYLLNPER